MLIPDTLFYFIMQNKELTCFPCINIRSVRSKRVWQKKSEEERRAFSLMRSRVQKRVFQENPELRKIRAKSFKKATKAYWDTVSEEKKQKHIEKMSAGMKKAWKESDDSFGPKISNRKIHGDIIIEKDLPRINDYAGVITLSELEQLNGYT